ncbi:MAG: hypothetical protein CMI18_12205 [Opitutaceae bacterium]|nr:hypothetical protein [Opitutaceae bacterium]|tara:strand:- start:2501 stop:2695 length:195 start_codon:yes stop_codon:yes gene_type:complete
MANREASREIIPKETASEQMTDENLKEIIKEVTYSKVFGDPNALDARYAVSNGILYSVFIYPLS